MSSANEQDVVIAFRQAVEEEMRKAQDEGSQRADKLSAPDLSTEELLSRLRKRHLELEHEVALLRTIVLRLISEPVDEQ
jgi:predicted nucleic acid-binding protein